MKEQNEKLQAGEIKVDHPIVKWFDNFWYHHKWAVIVVCFFVFVGVVCFSQCSQKQEGDLSIVFAGGYTLDQKEVAALTAALEAVAPQKQGQQGKLAPVFLSYSVYTDEELRAEFTDADGKFSAAAYQSAKQVSLNRLENFGTYITTGESAVWLVSEYVYEQRMLEQLSCPLRELFGESIPSSAYNEYAIRLGDTAFYQYYDAVKVLPPDTLLIMPKSFAWGESADDARYAEFLSFYYAIVNFKAP